MKTHTAWEIRFNEPDGTTQYVLATDYAALEVEIAAWRQDLESPCNACNGSGYHYLPSNVQGEPPDGSTEGCSKCGGTGYVSKAIRELILDRESLSQQLKALEAERDEWKRRCEAYEAREKADNETLHEFADYLSDKRAIAEGRDNG